MPRTSRGPRAIKQIRERGLEIVFELSAHPDPSIRVNNAVPRPITADRTLVIERPDLVARYLSVLLRTGRWAGATSSGNASAGRP